MHDPDVERDGVQTLVGLRLLVATFHVGTLRLAFVPPGLGIAEAARAGRFVEVVLEETPHFVVPVVGASGIVEEVMEMNPCGSLGAILSGTPLASRAAEHAELVVHFEGGAMLRALHRAITVRVAGA